MVIDAHAHYVPPSIVERLRADGARYGSGAPVWLDMNQAALGAAYTQAAYAPNRQ